MTYIADLDPEYRSMRAAADGHYRHIWDSLEPGWEEKGIEPEDRDTVSYSDVMDPEVPVVRGFGGNHRYIVAPGAHDEPLD